MHEKKLIVINYTLLFISTILFIFLSWSNKYTIPYLFCLLYFCLLSILNFITGININNQKLYKRNIDIYLVLYFILLISLTLFIGRAGISFISYDHFQYYIKSINLIPFKTIIGYLFGNANIKITIYNLLGNFVTLMPLSFLLFIKDEKYKKLKNQLKVLVLIVLSIELIQFIIETGRFDIDDFILNIGGALIFYLLLNKIPSLNKIKKLFYSDLKMNKNLKIILYIIFCLIIIGLNTIMIIDILA